MSNSFTPSDLQAKAIREIKDWFLYRTAEQQVFRVFGFAGTGKTTITRHAIDELGLDTMTKDADGVASVSDGVLYAAFTGKAALVMTRKGTPASTIHSLIYRVSEATPDEIERVKQEIAEIRAKLPTLDPAVRLFEESRLGSLELRLADIHKPRFVFNDQSIVRDAALIVLDEVSMVGDDMARDLLAFGKPILVLGDPGQLPPIRGEGAFTKAAPDVMLTEIHRQAGESAIVRLATMARQGLPIPYGEHDAHVWKMLRSSVMPEQILAQFYASGFLPEVWVPDENTLALRRQVTRRNQLVRQRTRLKNIVQSILHAHLVPPCPAADLFGAKGRAWLLQQELPEDERLAVARHRREYDRLSDDLCVVERDLARHALADQDTKRLMTIPGIDMVVALGMLAAVGEVSRFARPEHLVSYLGLNPSVRQSGPGPAYHGRITKQGRGHARGMLVEAAWAAARAPGPLRAFFLRISARRGQHVAAVATARKLAVLAWHLLRRQEDYAWVRPALHAKKIRDLELRAGYPARRGQRGAAYAYNLSTVRQRERRRVEQAEKAYGRLVRGWNPHGPKGRTGAAKEERS